MFDYIKKYGHQSFHEKPFNEVDNVILATAIYADFNGIIRRRGAKNFGEAIDIYLSTHDKKQVSRLGIAMKNAYLVLEAIVKAPRYRNIDVYHYRYIIDSDTQFSALTFRLTHDTKYIAFEGTDQMISGWKEDFYMSFRFPVDAQRYAIKYLNEVVSIFDHNIIIGGHSKGGNLAVVSAMYAHRFIKHRIRAIYSNDGPGLLEPQFNSREFASIKDKIVHIVPDYSLVGVVFKNVKHTVIKSTRRTVLAHAVHTWVVEDDRFKPSTLSAKSRRVEQVLARCMKKIPSASLEKIMHTVFRAMQKSGIDTTLDLLNIRNAIKILRGLGDVDDKTKKILVDTLSIVYKEFVSK